MLGVPIMEEGEVDNANARPFLLVTVLAVAVVVAMEEDDIENPLTRTLLPVERESQLTALNKFILMIVTVTSGGDGQCGKRQGKVRTEEGKRSRY